MSDHSYWRDKRVAVAGASRGFGLALAKAAASAGARTAICSRDREAVDAAAADLQRELSLAPDRVLPFAADMGRASDVEAFFAYVRERLGGLDGLFFCVGASGRGRIAETTAEDFQAAWEKNFLTAVRCARAALPDLIASQGHMVLTASLAAKIGAPFMGAYPASKAPLAAYAQQLRLELGPKGLHVLLVCPGPIAGETPAERRYQGAQVPGAAQSAGGGASLRALDPEKLAQRVLAGCERRQVEIVAPGKVRLLAAVSALSPSLGDWILRKNTPAE